MTIDGNRRSWRDNGGDEDIYRDYSTSLNCKLSLPENGSENKHSAADLKTTDFVNFR